MIHVRVRGGFWSKVDKNGPVHPVFGPCWVWTATKDKKGYGFTWIGPERKTRQHIRTHRLSYLLHVGPIPENLSVLHKCDNTSCVRPDHLFLGTQLDNMRDMCRKGRRRAGDARGLRNPRAILTPALIEIARAMYVRGDSYPTIAARFSVGPEAIGRALRGESWKGGVTSHITAAR